MPFSNVSASSTPPTCGRGNPLRDTISRVSDSVRASADGVLFEFGPSRNHDLAWRSKIREWQPQLRLLFLAEVALWKYRARVPGFELPESVRVAQRAFDYELARKLAELADRMEGRSPGAKPRDEWLAPLERTVSTYDANEPQKQTAIRLQAFLSLHRRVENIATSLQKDLNVV